MLSLSHRWRARAVLSAARDAVTSTAVGAVVIASLLFSPAAQAQPITMAQPRPKLEVAVGMGASIDSAGLNAAGTSAIPSFFAMGGFGQGTIGADFGVFANSATGRYRSPNVPVDRLAVDGMLVIRPAAEAQPDDDRYRLRVLRTVAFDLGLGYERDSRINGNHPEEVSRLGYRIGGHVDVPLTAVGASSELRVRLGARRFIGLSSRQFPGGDPAPDSRVELFAALAAVF